MPYILLGIADKIFYWLIDQPMWKQVAFFIVSFSVVGVLIYLASLL